MARSAEDDEVDRQPAKHPLQFIVIHFEWFTVIFIYQRRNRNACHSSLVSLRHDTTREGRWDLKSFG
jgi:hypothetical protein